MDAPRPPRVLVVDDDAALRGLLHDYLAASGLDVDLAGDAQQMRHHLSVARADAIVLDLMLPGEDGLSITRELRRESQVPILMLSARGEETDRVVGLEFGADDYMAKPFSPRELLARLRALLRRARSTPSAQAPRAESARPGLHRFGPYVLDTEAWRLLRGNDEVALSTAEFELLRVFVAQPNRVLSRDHLIETLKGYDRDAFDRSIDVRVTRLRHQIEPDPSHPMYIRTVRGAGYLFNPLGNAS